MFNPSYSCATFMNPCNYHKIQVNPVFLFYRIIHQLWLDEARKRPRLHLNCSYPGGVILGDVPANHITLTRLAVLALKL